MMQLLRVHSREVPFKAISLEEYQSHKVTIDHDEKKTGVLGDFMIKRSLMDRVKSFLRRTLRRTSEKPESKVMFFQSRQVLKLLKDRKLTIGVDWAHGKPYSACVLVHPSGLTETFNADSLSRMCRDYLEQPTMETNQPENMGSDYDFSGYSKTQDPGLYKA